VSVCNTVVLVLMWMAGCLDPLTQSLLTFEDNEDLERKIIEVYAKLDEDGSGGLDFAEFRDNVKSINDKIHMTCDDFDMITENGKHLTSEGEFGELQFIEMMKGELWRFSRRGLSNVLKISGDEQFRSTVLMLKLFESEVIGRLRDISSKFECLIQQQASQKHDRKPLLTAEEAQDMLQNGTDPTATRHHVPAGDSASSKHQSDKAESQDLQRMWQDMAVISANMMRQADRQEQQSEQMDRLEENQEQQNEVLKRLQALMEQLHAVLTLNGEESPRARTSHVHGEHFLRPKRSREELKEHDGTSEVFVHSNTTSAQDRRAKDRRAPLHKTGRPVCRPDRRGKGQIGGLFSPVLSDSPLTQQEADLMPTSRTRGKDRAGMTTRDLDGQIHQRGPSITNSSPRTGALRLARSALSLKDHFQNGRRDAAQQRGKEEAPLHRSQQQREVAKEMQNVAEHMRLARVSSNLSRLSSNLFVDLEALHASPSSNSIQRAT
jgi:hypothetical protein